MGQEGRVREGPHQKRKTMLCVGSHSHSTQCGPIHHPVLFLGAEEACLQVASSANVHCCVNQLESSVISISSSSSFKPKRIITEIE